MPRRLPPANVRRASVLVTVLAAAAILLGALLWFRPYVTKKQVSVSAVPAPNALTATTSYQLAPGEQACMTAVAVEPQTAWQRSSSCTRRRPARRVGRPVALVLSAPGYRSVSQLAGGYPGGLATLPVTPPKHSLLATACFVNRGDTDVVLLGSAEARTISRSGTSVGGVSVVGDVALTLFDTHRGRAARAGRNDLRPCLEPHRPSDPGVADLDSRRARPLRCRPASSRLSTRRCEKTKQRRPAQATRARSGGFCADRGCSAGTREEDLNSHDQHRGGDDREMFVGERAEPVSDPGGKDQAAHDHAYEHEHAAEHQTMLEAEARAHAIEPWIAARP